MYTPAALESVYTYDYDQKGNVSTREYDAKNDSITDFIVYYTYDSETRTVTEERDTDANGEIDERYTYEYNAEGYLVEENKNPSQDGASEERIVYDYVFDEDGLITELNWEKSEGELIHLYDEDGNYSKVAEYEVLSKTTAKYQYDDEGRVVVVEYAVTQGDYPGAEPKKQRHLYTYDEQGNIRSHEQDCDCDGKRESLVVYSYDCEPLEDSSVGDSSN
jgi:YD repeat-containing protein